MDLYDKCSTVISSHTFVFREAEQIKEVYHRVLQCTDCGLMVIRTNIGEIVLSGTLFKEDEDGPSGV